MGTDFSPPALVHSIKSLDLQRLNFDAVSLSLRSLTIILYSAMRQQLSRIPDSVNFDPVAQ
jgi:hypothetical protein